MHSYALLCLAKKRNPNKCTVRVYLYYAIIYQIVQTQAHILGQIIWFYFNVKLRNYIELVYSIRSYYLRAYLQ